MLLLLIAVSIVTVTTPSFAQTDSVKVTEETVPELISPAVELTIVQFSNNNVSLNAVYKAKIKGSFMKLPGLHTEFYNVAGADIIKLGDAVTSSKGVALLNIAADKLKADDSGAITIKTIFAGTKTFEASEEHIVFKRARLEITPVKGDSLNSLQLKLVDLSTGIEKTIPDATLGVYVKRMFSNLKIGEGTSDENGQATIEVPGKLPGDAKGNLTLIARLDESEVYGNLEATVSQQWGVPVSDKIQELPRALWSTHPPLWMLITFIVLVSTVWGHYLVIIVQLFRLRKDV